MLPSLRACLVLPVLLCTAAGSLIAQPGSLSSSFGVNGLLTDPSRQAFEKAITSQPDKKILTGSQGFYQGYQTFLTDRLLPDGAKDPLFGTGGTAYVLFTDTNGISTISSEINAIALLPDGKIIAAGHADGSGKHIALARLLPNGSSDISFGKNGTSLTGFGIDEILNGIAVQPDGKLVICGMATPDFTPGNNRFFVARYLPGGSVDSSFGTGGIVVSSYTGSANAVAIQPDGSIIAGGYSTEPDGISFHIERYGADGSYDKSYGINGIVNSRINGGFLNFINDIALQADGRLLAAGRTNGGGMQAFTITRYNSNGSPDNSFGTGGVVTTTFPGVAGEARKVLLTAKGDHILATGTYSGNRGSDFMVASYTLSGTADTAFGNNGVVITDFGGDDMNSSATLCSDGSLVASGSNTGQYPFAVRALAKYNGYPVTVPLYVRVKRWWQNHTLTWNGLPASDDVVRYAIEQSGNGRTGFAEIAGVGGTAHLKEYSLTNPDPLTGANYYRIKAISADGAISYSETVSIDNVVPAISVYPNPARDAIVIKGLAVVGTSYISIANNSGNVMMKAVSNGTEQHRMTVSWLQKGTYYVTVIAPDGSVEKGMFVKE